MKIMNRFLNRIAIKGGKKRKKKKDRNNSLALISCLWSFRPELAAMGNLIRQQFPRIRSLKRHCASPSIAHLIYLLVHYFFIF